MSGVYDVPARLFRGERDEQLRQVRVWTLSRRLEIAMCEEAVKEAHAELAETDGEHEQNTKMRELIMLYEELIGKVMR